MINKAEDRSVAVSALAKAVGGKLVDYYVTFGDYDFMAIIESGTLSTTASGWLPMRQVPEGW